MSEPDDFNPYAPPKAEPPARPAKPERIKRPGAVKWAIAFMVLSSAVMGYSYAELYLNTGWLPLIASPWATVMDALRFVACAGLLFGGRNSWVYWITAIPLALHSFNLRSGPLVFPDHHTGVNLLSLLLFYKFTFGKSTRAYFNVASTRDLPLTPRIPPAP